MGKMKILVYLVAIYFFVLFAFQLLGRKNLVGFGIASAISTALGYMGFMFSFRPQVWSPVPTARQRIIGGFIFFGLATVILILAITWVL